MIIKKLGQILGLFSSVAIIFSVFLSYVDLDVMGVSIFSMSLFDFNKEGAFVIAVLALLAFISSYASKGLITSLLGIIIFVFSIFLCANDGTGNEKLDQGLQILNSFLGDMTKPGVGFYVAISGAILLFFAGCLMRGDLKKKEDTPSWQKYM